MFNRTLEKQGFHCWQTADFRANDVTEGEKTNAGRSQERWNKSIVRHSQTTDARRKKIEFRVEF